MTNSEIQELLSSQRSFFATGATLKTEYRISALKKLKSAIKTHEADIMAALKKDLGKGSQESYMCEVGLTLSEISYMLSHVKRFARERTVATPLAQFASRSYVKPSPYGNVLIMSPWNYPFFSPWNRLSTPSPPEIPLSSSQAPTRRQPAKLSEK